MKAPTQAPSPRESSSRARSNPLRSKLETDPMRPELILTVRGAGYKMRDTPS